MMMNPSAVHPYDQLLSRLDAFIRKYYRNQMIRGAILFIALLLVSFLVVALLEYFGRFSSGVRTVLFYFYLALNLALLGYYVLVPLFHLNKIGKIISHEQAASIIGRHFSEVQDKLLNILQLKGLLDHQTGSRDLLLAGIEQKTHDLKPVPFESAINLKSNTRYLKYVAIPLVVLIVMLVGTPRVLTESTTRLVAFKKDFVKPQPFHFELMNDSLSVLKGADLELNVAVRGDILPDRVFLSVDGRQLGMSRISNGHYRYVFHHLVSGRKFRFFADNIYSQNFEVKVLPKPMLNGFSLSAEYPAYTGIKDEVFENMGDLSVPEGTVVSWEFNVSETENITIQWGDKHVFPEQKSKNTYSYSKRLTGSTHYLVQLANRYVKSQDTIEYFVNVVPDAYPRISVVESKDSLAKTYLFFSGTVSDDYGISRLEFKYRMINEEDSAKAEQDVLNRTVDLVNREPYQGFVYSMDIKDLGLKPGQKLEYYFETWDNDGIHGPKSAVSRKFFYQAPTKKELENKMDDLANDIKNDLKDANKKANEIKDELTGVRKKMLEDKSLKWEDKELLKSVLEKQKELENEVEKIKEKYKEQINTENDYNKLEDNILEKYEELYKLFDEVVPDEMKELYEELQELLDKNMKNEIEKELDKMDLNNDNVEKELDRMLELFKQMQFDQKVEKMAGKLDELAEKQDKLGDETKDRKKETETVKNKQEELNKEFEDIEKEMEELDKMNNELDKPREMEDFEPDKNEINKEQQNSMDNLNQGSQKKASQNQKNAAKKMKEMAEKMRNMAMQMQMQQMEINVEKLRQILENLVYVSFQQEKLIDKFLSVNSYNPQYVDLVQEQKKIQDDTKMIEDSLYALGREVPQISSYINKELSKVNFNLKQSVDLLSERQVPDARAKQQFAMTSINNIAVLLSEVLKNLQSDMQSSMMGSSGNKKGKSNMPSLGDLKKMQDELNKQIEGLKKGMMPGKKNMSKQLAQMAARQEMLRNAIRQMEMEKAKNGEKPSKELQEIQKLMEETEKELVHKKVTPETLRRQKEITVKLLEAEKAELKQGKEKKRESKTGSDLLLKEPPSLEKYLKQKEKEVELLQKIPPTLKPYYKMRVKEYFRNLQKED